MKNALTILVHSGTPSTELLVFFKKHEIRVVSLSEYQNTEKITHVLVSGSEDFPSIAQTFDAVENDVRLVAISLVKDLLSFVSNNGRFIIDPQWLECPMGQVALEKFFLGKASIQLDENFPTMKEHVGFKVTNHLRVGIDLDRMSSYIHEHDGPVARVRTFVDHAFYYLTYLKQACVASNLIEVDYGHTGQEAIVQIHTTVKGYMAEYLIDSFNTPTLEDPIRYLMTVCAHSADFLEVQYIQQVGKLVITAVWQPVKGERHLRYNALMINQVLSAVQMENKLRRDLAPVELPDTQNLEKINELGEKPLPGHIMEIVVPPIEHDGYLKERPELARNLVAFVVDQCREQHPDKKTSDIGEGEIVNMITEYYENEEVANLVEADLKHVMESVKKSAVTQTYSTEIEKIRGQMQEDEEVQKVLGDSFADKVAQKVSAGMTPEDFAQLVKGAPLEKDDSSTKVKGLAEEEEAINKVKGGIEEALSKQIIAGEKVKPDDFVMRISKGITEQSKGNWNVRFGSGQAAAPEAVKNHLTRFAASMGQTLDSLSAKDLQVFTQKELPRVLHELVQVDASLVIPATPPTIKDSIQVALQAKIKELYPNKKPEDVVNIITAEEQEVLLKTVIKSSIKDMATPGDNDSQKKLTTELAQGLFQNDEMGVQSLIDSAKNDLKKEEGQLVLKKLFDQKTSDITGGPSNDTSYEMLTQKMRQLQVEHTKSQEQLEKARAEIRILKESRELVQKMNQKIKEASDSNPAAPVAPVATELDSVVDNEMSLEKKQQILQDLSSGKAMNPEDLQKLKDSLDREQKIIEIARKTENEVRKAKLEIQQREAFFTQELEKANRGMKSKDLIAQKAKDGLAHIMAKKDKEIADLNAKISAVVGGLAANQANNQQQNIRELEKDKQGLVKLVDVYKQKMASMATRMEAMNSGAGQGGADEIRKLQIDKQRAEVMVQSVQREALKLKQRSELDQAEIQRLRLEKSKLDDSLKQAVAQGQSNTNQNQAKDNKLEKKLQELQNEALVQTQKASRAESRAQELEKKISELNALVAKNQSGASDTAAKSKITQMETTVKKLSVDLAAAGNQLAESKKEINKARAENTALKNQIEKLKKDAEKAAKTTPGAKKAS